MNKIIVFILCVMLQSCGTEPKPKAKGELRISLPEHAYRDLSTSCPFDMEIPVYSRYIEKSKSDSSCWSDLQFPKQKAIIHLTYRSVRDDLPRLLDESLGLTYEHHIMADNIDDVRVLHPERDVYGTMSYVYGNVASNVQFYVTDSTDHFLRGALYFNCPPNKDSLAPVIEHLQHDIENMLASLNWRD